MPTTYEPELREFEENGYIFVPNLLNEDETALVFAAPKSDTEMLSNAFDIADAQGGNSRLTGWSHPDDDVYGMVARVPRVVDRMEVFLGGEVYHYNSKMMLKERRDRRRVGVASGLRVLVSKRLPVSVHGELYDRARCHQ